MRLENIEFEIIKGDITEINVQAIVNAANNQFFMGGGVAGAIKKKGGEVIEDEAVALGPVAVGESVVTSGGSLPSEYVVHAATMEMDFKTNEAIIRKATASSLSLAHEKGIVSLAFPALGCGVGKFPLAAAAKIMAQEVFRYARTHEDPVVKKIVFVLFSHAAYTTFEETVAAYLIHLFAKSHQGPFLTVDGIVEYQGGVVMIKRTNPPLGWAFPGGFVDCGESVEEAVVREVKEETNLDFVEIRQFHVYSQPDRDPRFHTVAVVFAGRGEGMLTAASDACDACVVSLDELPQEIAFDHRDILASYYHRKKSRI